MRSNSWLLHENDMYNELRMDCANDFTNCRTHLDYLVEMQHYGLPTRLLDVTKNPLGCLCLIVKEKRPDHQTGRRLHYLRPVR